MDDDEDERRVQDRVTINKEFESFDAFVHEYVTNISRHGAFIKSKEPLAIGTRVNLCFTVITDDIETIEGEGEVVRVQEDPPGMGVVFTELSKCSEHLIERLLVGSRSSTSTFPVDNTSEHKTDQGDSS
ncbi:MAG: PilZ domain-containing protein [Myxococcota bacterium]